jgi:hypothetical protein
MMRKPTLPALRRLGLVGGLLALSLVAVACVSGSPAPAATAVSQPTATQAPQAGAAPASQEVGASGAKSPAAASVKHWQGDPNAPVVMVEISDYQ